jgi:hypothetical protein
MAVTILGIRHHGVGSAIRCAEQLQLLKPDIVLIEGPPEITEGLKIIGHSQLQPPVALLVYNEADAKQASFYPFHHFSPEWVAAKYANENKIPVRALDMPAAIAYQIANDKIEAVANSIKETENTLEAEQEQSMDATEVEKEIIRETPELSHNDPMLLFANAAGFDDVETWWDEYFETSSISNAEEHFAAIDTVMCAMRNNEAIDVEDSDTYLRELFMRNEIRKAQNEMFQRIVVICGAWHLPALKNVDDYNKTDEKLKKQVPKTKIKINSSWIPWTNERLSMYSGYGAGITAPGWYEHIWDMRTNTELHWLIKVAQCFRKNKVDISSAHIIEAQRLLQAVQILRSKRKAGLQDINEVCLSVMCMGDSIQFSTITNEIFIAQKIGAVPNDITKVPLQQDFEALVKSLRLKLSAFPTDITLDLRKQTDMEKSVFFNRLRILGLTWAQRTYAKTKGTFKEVWRLDWTPEYLLTLIDNAYLGSTIFAAADAKIRKRALEANKMDEVVLCLEQILEAELFHSVDDILNHISNLATISSDINDSIVATPKLIEIARYGNVRKADTSILQKIIDGLLNKLFINLPNATYGLNEEHSHVLSNQIGILNEALRLLENINYVQHWYACLQIIVQKEMVHAIIKGKVNRLLFDAQQFTEVDTERIFNFALSTTNPPQEVAFWLEGFLGANGAILLYNDKLWNLLYNWVSLLQNDVFNELLPMLRRAFTKFGAIDKRQIGEKAAQGFVSIANVTETNINFDYAFAEKSIETTLFYLGYKPTKL